MDVKVRVGTVADLDEVMELARLTHAEIGLTAFNAERVLPDIYAALTKNHGIMGLIGDPGTPLQGGILLRVGKLFYSDDDVLEDRGLFVRPEHRTAKRGEGRPGRQPHAILLCEFAKQAADALGIPLVIGIQSSVNTEGKLRLYERQFGKPIGAFFMYNPAVAEKSEAA